MSKLFGILKRHALRIVISLAILIFFLLQAGPPISSNFLQALEHRAYDVRLQLTMPNTVDTRIVIIDIDDKSLKEIGHWPWPRETLAKLLDLLFHTYHIDVLGMDVVFAEADNSSGLHQLDELARGDLRHETSFLTTLEKLRPALDYDQLFAKSIQEHKVALGYTFNSAQSQNSIQSFEEIGDLPTPTVSAEQLKENGLIYRFPGRGFVTNLPIFQRSATAAGHFTSAPDADGIIRKIPILFGYNGNLYESLSLAVTRLALGVDRVELGPIHPTSSASPSLEYLQIGDRHIPVDNNLQTYIPYRGQWGSFPYVSATDILHERIPEKDRLTNTIALLGTTAQGLMDLRSTPMQRVYPGVEVHANLISGILDNQLRYSLPYQNSVEVSLLIGVGLIMILLLPLFSPLIATLGTLMLSGIIIGINMFLWNNHIVFPLAPTLLLILFLFIFNMSYGFFVETTNKRYLTHLFGQYIPPELVDKMNKHLGQKFTLESESRDMTVLFSDVRGFTTISEGLEPKELSELMNAYLTPMTRIIHDHRGTIDKYMGDAIMAFWGAPLSDPLHARHAIEAAMQMLKQLKEMQPQFKAHGWPEIKIGVGLNTGIMNVGNMGSQFRMAYTVLGDAVNLGSRLEGITKQYGVQLIVSETTKAAAPEYIYRELDRVRVKGKEHPVAIYEPIGLHDKVSQDELEEIIFYEKALDYYRTQHWDLAQAQFAQLHSQHPNRLLYKIYADRVEYFLNHPPGNDWDGVYTFTTK